MRTFNWKSWAALAMVAASLSGCGGGSDGSSSSTTPPTSTVDFSAYANQAFANQPNSMPVSVDVNFVFDVNDQPTAFDALILSGTY